MRKVTLKGLLQAAAFLTTALTLVTLVPFDHHALQLFTHFRLQYLAASVLLLAIFAFLRSPAFTIVLLISAAANGATVVPWYTNQEQPAGNQQLKVMLANVLSTNVEHDRLISLVASEKPDVLFLQEISPQWETALAALLGDYPHHHVEARSDNFGIALLSRWPIAQIARVESEPMGYPTLCGEFDIEGQRLRFVSTHPMIPVGAHNFATRNAQLEDVAKQLGASETATILAGDLNTTMWDMHYRALEDATRLRNVRRGHGVKPTWPTFMPFAMIPIDHVLVSNDIAVETVTAGPGIGSDHLPLIVTLSL
ncbi:MAG: endonuclease/exonuclease/phosphatase family protein [Woeseiaceae bacterium]|nr:endonuclease/exonuclease/phosphatase family protein [Woeseiaceae bacterium]